MWTRKFPLGHLNHWKDKHAHGKLNDNFSSVKDGASFVTAHLEMVPETRRLLMKRYFFALFMTMREKQILAMAIETHKGNSG